MNLWDSTPAHKTSYLQYDLKKSKPRFPTPLRIPELFREFPLRFSAYGTTVTYLLTCN